MLLLKQALLLSYKLSQSDTNDAIKIVHSESNDNNKKDSNHWSGVFAEFSSAWID